MRNSGAICNFHPARLTRLVNYSGLNRLTSVLCRARLNLTIQAALTDHFAPRRAVSRRCGVCVSLFPVAYPLPSVITIFFTTAILRAEFLKNPIIYFVAGRCRTIMADSNSPRKNPRGPTRKAIINLWKFHARQSKYNLPFLASSFQFTPPRDLHRRATNE